MDIVHFHKLVRCEHIYYYFAYILCNMRVVILCFRWLVGLHHLEVSTFRLLNC